MTFAYQIDEAEAELDAIKARYLTRWGWTATCETPGSYWMWRRDFADYDATFDAWYAAHPERTRPQPTGALTLPLDLAVSMTRRALDEQPELAGEED